MWWNYGGNPDIGIGQVEEAAEVFGV